MPYPYSPFTETFRTDVIFKQTPQSEPTDTTIEFENILKWICSCPKITTYRINILKCDIKDVKSRIDLKLKTVSENRPIISAQLHPTLQDTIVIKNWDVQNMEFPKYEKEIIVDVDCAAAVLRGAHIYAPGVIGMVSGTDINNNVSIYADLDKKCKKGFLKIYDGQKLYIGNGIVRMTRNQLYGENLTPNGVAIEVTETIFGCPPLGDDFLPKGWALLQNLPSIVCVNVLNPQPNECVLDMCASPGNKTTHIAALMRNQGTLVAIDKTPTKVKQLQSRCEEFGAKVCIYQCDSSKILLSEGTRKINEGPPFLSESFDRILLDAPCSVLGKRPQLLNTITNKVLNSYVPLQRKLFETAANLLKVNGTLVYSTCTITLAENEGMVAWALKTFPYLKLVRSKCHYGGPGWDGTSLTPEQRQNVQRFGPDQEIDSVGFFVACFIKNSL